jgi:hypothetical protein
VPVTPLGQQLLDIAQAQMESKVEPDSVTDDLDGIAGSRDTKAAHRLRQKATTPGHPMRPPAQLTVPHGGVPLGEADLRLH